MKFDTVEDLPLHVDYHYHLYVPTFFEFDGNANDVIDFVFDTGAFLTVITRKTAENFEFLDRFTVQKDVSLTGFSGQCLADIKEIPGFVIGGKKLVGVKVAVPHTDTGVDLLGLNVLEHFKYFIDTENDKVHFAENPSPNIPNELKAKNVYALSS
jgi:predicted aspartyl protease